MPSQVVAQLEETPRGEDSPPEKTALVRIYGERTEVMIDRFAVVLLCCFPLTPTTILIFGVGVQGERADNTRLPGQTRPLLSALRPLQQRYLLWLCGRQALHTRRHEGPREVQARTHSSVSYISCGIFLTTKKNQSFLVRRWLINWRCSTQWTCSESENPPCSIPSESGCWRFLTLLMIKRRTGACPLLL